MHLPLGHYRTSQTLTSDWKPPTPFPAPCWFSCGTVFIEREIAKTLASPCYDITGRMSHIPIVKLNYFELVVHTVSDRCQDSLCFPQLSKRLPGTSDQGVSAHCLEPGRPINHLESHSPCLPLDRMISQGNLKNNEICFKGALHHFSLSIILFSLGYFTS